VAAAVVFLTALRLMVVLVVAVLTTFLVELVQLAATMVEQAVQQLVVIQKVAVAVAPTQLVLTHHSKQISVVLVDQAPLHHIQVLQ